MSGFFLASLLHTHQKHDILTDTHFAWLLCVVNFIRKYELTNSNTKQILQAETCRSVNDIITVIAQYYIHAPVGRLNIRQISGVTTNHNVHQIQIS